MAQITIDYGELPTPTPTPEPVTIEQFVLCPATEYAKANIIATSYASGYLPEYAFNDATNNGWNCDTPDYNKTNCYIGYDFGTPVAVIGAYYYGPTNYAHGWHYKLWGRNDAADEWTELSTEYTTQAGYISSNSLEKYRYIALNCYVDGTGAGYSAVQIVKFYGFR